MCICDISLGKTMGFFSLENEAKDVGPASKEIREYEIVKVSFRVYYI